MEKLGVNPNSIEGELQARLWIESYCENLGHTWEKIPEEIILEAVSLASSSVFYKLKQYKLIKKQDVDEQQPLIVDILSNQFGIYEYQLKYGNNKPLPDILNKFKYGLLEGEKIATLRNMVEEKCPGCPTMEREEQVLKRILFDK